MEVFSRRWTLIGRVFGDDLHGLHVLASCMTKDIMSSVWKKTLQMLVRLFINSTVVDYCRLVFWRLVRLGMLSCCVALALSFSDSARLSRNAS